MVNKKFVVKLSGEERERLREVISRGKAKAKIILKARILLKADQGWSDAEICRGDCQIVCVRGFREGGFRFSSSCVETEASKAWSASLLGCSERSSPKAA